MDLTSFARMVIGNKGPSSQKKARRNSVLEAQREYMNNQAEVLAAATVERSRGSTLYLRHLDLENSCIPDKEEELLDDDEEEEEDASIDPFAVVAQRAAKKAEKKAGRRSQVAQKSVDASAGARVARSGSSFKGTAPDLTAQPSMSANLGAAAAAVSPFNKVLRVADPASSTTPAPQGRVSVATSLSHSGRLSERVTDKEAANAASMDAAGALPAKRSQPPQARKSNVPLWLADDDTSLAAAPTVKRAHPGLAADTPSPVKALPPALQSTGGFSSFRRGAPPPLESSPSATGARLIGGMEPGTKGRAGRRRSITVNSLDDALASALTLASDVAWSPLSDKGPDSSSAWSPAARAAPAKEQPPGRSKSSVFGSIFGRDR